MGSSERHHLFTQPCGCVLVTDSHGYLVDVQRCGPHMEEWRSACKTLFDSWDRRLTRRIYEEMRRKP